MELVRGPSLRTCCRGVDGAEAPPLRERLQVFLAACEAVAYAHQNGVIVCGNCFVAESFRDHADLVVDRPRHPDHYSM